ncbi:MAG TPA: 2-dehydro-3-deoxygalactonokinase [Microbacteriaceae bacterium]|nr:2-dehydro-3-deoxygalactonokinase [Microbacteriaceae bacterium]
MTKPATPDTSQHRRARGTHDAAPALIGVDWGSSRLRAYLLTADGRVLETLTRDVGILGTPVARQREVLSRALAPWLRRHPAMPIVAAGMIGSSSGMVETSPVAAPADAAKVAAGVSHTALADGTDVVVLPGLVDRHGDHDDLLRGEEAQILGWLASPDAVPEAVLVLPGTHSKWVRIAAGTIRGFHTFPTGELFATLRETPSLKSAREARGGQAASKTPGDATPGRRPAVNAAAFRDAVTRGLASPGLSHDLFGLRVTALARGAGHAATPPAAPFPLDDALSGLLLGHEIHEATGRGLLAERLPVVVVGDLPLSERYRTALEVASLEATVADAERCVARGIATVHALA